MTLRSFVCVEKAEVCLFQGITVLEPGQSLVQYFEGELCYTVHCLHHKDPNSGFFAMQIASVNCSQKCGSVCDQSHITSLHIITWLPMIGSHFPIFPSVSWSVFSIRCMCHPLIPRCAVVPAKTCLVLLSVTMEPQSSSLWDQTHPKAPSWFFFFGFFFRLCIVIVTVFAGRKFMGGELHPLRLCGNVSRSSDSCFWGGLSSFQWYRVYSGKEVFFFFYTCCHW